MNIGNEIVTIINVIDTLLNFFAKASHPSFSKELLDNNENQIRAFRDHLSDKYKSSLELVKKEEAVNHSEMVG